MNFVDEIAEKQILEAIERGELADLPGAGKPLDLTDDAAVPEELRMAYRVLKNAGYVPPEVTLRKEINELQAAIYSTEDSVIARRAARRLSLLMTELGRNGSTHLSVEDAYYRKIVARFSR